MFILIFSLRKNQFLPDHYAELVLDYTQHQYELPFSHFFVPLVQNGRHRNSITNIITRPQIPVYIYLYFSLYTLLLYQYTFCYRSIRY